MKILKRLIHNQKKFIINTLTIGLLFNTAMPSFAGILSDDKRYETFIDNNITVNDVIEDDKTDIKIEGNTLVNLWKGFTLWHPNGWIQGKIQNENIQGDITVFNFSSKDILFELSYTDGSYSRGIYVPSNQRIKINVLPNEKFRMIQGNSGKGWDNTPENIEEFNNSIMVLEGDYSEENIEYFKEMQSSFENQLVTQDMINKGEEKTENLGKYKVEVKSRGKNLLPNNFINETGGGTGALDGLVYPNMFHQSNNRLRSADLIPVKSDTQYIINCTDTFDFAIIEFDANKRQIIDTGWILYQNNNTYTTSNNCVYIVLVIRKTGVTPEDPSYLLVEEVLNKIQLEEGSISTEYEPYKESTSTFYLNSPLLEGETIEYINGKATHVRRYNQLVFDGSDDEDWRPSSMNTTIFLNIGRIFYIKPNPLPYKEATEWSTPIGLYCYNFIPEKPVCSQMHEEFVPWAITTMHSSNPSEGELRLTTDVSVSDLTKFKKWLSENPTKVVYKLKNPIYEQIEADLSVELFEGTTYVLNNSNIPANTDITVDRTLNRAVEAIELAKNMPNIENISIARMWTNLAKETMKKDELQNEINSITKIKDLNIEKKAISSNVDIYIKPENSLSMSLSTNYITFEDYSSVNDLDMDNAVKITVNSSLPYRLNSYLETQIQNENGTNRIDKEFLHIKEDTDGEYKQFLGINQKLTLKEDCEAGKSNIHYIDFKLKASTHDADIYKTTIKFEAEQK